MNEIESLELKIAKFLRFGVVVAGVLMFIGWVTQIKFTPNPFYTFQIYDEIPVMELIDFYVRRDNWGILTSYAGLLVLISLPVIRVMLTAWLFVRQKEFILALIAFIVLIALIVSMSLGIDL